MADTGLPCLSRYRNRDDIDGKAKTGALDIDAVCEIHDNLVAADPRLRNPLGIPALFDVINVAAAQDLVNALQGHHLSRQNIPDSSLLALPNTS
ncbi:hypothetical protein J155_01346 [Xanthomonas citri pv. citri]|nr:hypothetical protein J151_01348 [Xanthomonas citri subsp. citri A306]AJY81331.1 hypothetical protein J159_01345 [Xanthomonas citri pv. citri]AJY85753.1 hypothetical protein J158_01345 [Xanthomonas citri subsp. citri UI6]AJY90176.1 hypothetical protein J169_01344 [Xanthomonas citri pv. citri]AJY94647.1 hypothetical protein J164_01344 [Xanthomonas citri pv. citri]